jgi:arabinofuranan 3-O-arabinosyltransferase
VSEGREHLRIGMGSALKSRQFAGLSWNKISDLEDRIFTEWRIRLYALSIAGLYSVLLAWEILLNGRSVINNMGKPRCIDFCYMWVSGKIAVSGDPFRVYDYSAFSSLQAILVSPPIGNYPPFHFLYPPTFLLFTLPLGLMSYFVAFAVWTIATLILYLAAVYMILPRTAALLAAVTPFCVTENIILGYNGFLTAALIGLSLAFLERRPLLSGIFLGLLTYKPHFGILFPFALFASHRWRAISSATATSVIFAVIATATFGFQGWSAVIDSLLDRTSGLSTDQGLVLTLQSAFGLLYWAGAGARVAWIAHLAVAAAVTLVVCVVWAKRIPYSLKAATLCVGSVMVTPYVQIYDLCILSIAITFLVSDELSRGFLPGEPTAILICWVSLFFMLRPLGLILYIFILILIARRIVAYGRNPGAASRDVPVGYALSPSGTRP